MAVVSTQLLTEMSTKDISWEGGVKAAVTEGLHTLPPSSTHPQQILRASTFWSPTGLSRPVMG